MPFSRSCSLTDRGLHRDNNEDCYLSVPELGIWAVADGMGGHEAGEVASAIVIDTLRRHSQRGAPLDQAIAHSHHAVLQAVDNGNGAAGMGSTVVALSSQEQNYRICWVGDSRAYLWSLSEDGGQLQQLTTDHSYVQLLLASGAISRQEAEQHPDKHIITQCIGSAELQNVRVDCVEGCWEDDQWLLLCSDGLSDELDDGEIAQILAGSSNIEDAARALLKQALQQGGRDNVTLQLIQSPKLKTARRRRRLVGSLPRISAHAWLDYAIYSAALVGAIALVTLLLTL